MAEPQTWGQDDEVVGAVPATGQGVVIPAAREKPAAPNLPTGFQMGPGGVAERIPGIVDPNDPTKGVPTESERTAGFLAGRILDAVQRLAPAAQKNPEAQAPTTGVEMARGFAGNAAANLLNSPERRQIYAAQRDILDAALTLGTGAAYNKEQLAGYEVSYLPQLYDDPETIRSKRQALRSLLQEAARKAGRSAPNIDAAITALDQLPNIGGTPKSVGAGAFMTDQDSALQSEAQAAFDRGASLEELNAIAARYGRPEFQGLDRAIKAREDGTKGIKATVEPTGFNEAPSALQDTAAGYAVGAANALTAGNLDELAPILGLDPQRVEAAKAYLRENAPVSSFIGEGMGGALASVPAIRGAGAMLAGSRLAASAPLAGEMLYGGTYGAGEAPEGQKLTGAAIGAGGAAAGGMLANRFLPGGSGTFLGRETPQPTQSFGGPQANPETVIEAGRQFNVPVMTSDVSPPRTFIGKVSQQVGDFAPFGTAGSRRGQQEARQQAVETLLVDAGVTIDQNFAKEVVSSLTQKRALDIKNFSNLKNEVIDRLDAAGDVSAPKALDAIDKLIGSLKGEDMSRQLGKLISDLEDTKRSLTGPGGLRKIENNRATIFGLKGDKALSNVKGKAEKSFSAVYNALNDDMGDFIKANGDPKDFVKWKVANKKLATMIGELEQQGLKRVLDKGDFDPDVVRKMLNSKNPQEARLLFTNLGKKGRENTRLLLLQDAAQRAFNSQTKEINPQEFAKAVTSNENAFRMFFGGEEAKKVKGLTALFTATRRAQEAQFAPRTGERLVPFLSAGSFGGLATLLGMDFAGGIGLASGFGAARSLYESAPVRNLLVKIGQTSGSAQGQLINKLNQTLAASAGAVTAEKVAGPEPMTFGAPAQ